MQKKSKTTTPFEAQPIRESLTPELATGWNTIVQKLSFTHLAKLLKLDNQLFVLKYQLELPKKEEIQKFLEKQIAGETDS